MSTSAVGGDHFPAPATPTKRVYLVDDHPLFRCGLATCFQLEADVEVTGIAATLEDGTRRAGAGGNRSKRADPGVILDALRAVADGGTYVSKRFATDPVYLALTVVGTGRSPVDVLSIRERKVFGLVGRGLSTPQMAASLAISGKTVESHRLRIKEKLKNESAAELAAFARELERLKLMRDGDFQGACADC